jgi:hypothetical protein
VAGSMTRDDLVVLVADSNQEAVLDVLLRERRDSLRIRPVTFELRRHPGNDPGVYHEAAAFLRPYRRTHTHTIVLLDADWEGAPGTGPKLEATVVEALQRTGWPPADALVLAVEPEIETWAWRNVGALAGALGVDVATVRELAQAGGWWRNGMPKPDRPKELLEDVLRSTRTPRSSSLYARLARQLSLRGCQDASFGRLVEALRRWFPAP